MPLGFAIKIFKSINSGFIEIGRDREIIIKFGFFVFRIIKFHDLGCRGNVMSNNPI